MQEPNVVKNTGHTDNKQHTTSLSGAFVEGIIHLVPFDHPLGDLLVQLLYQNSVGLRVTNCLCCNSDCIVELTGDVMQSVVQCFSLECFSPASLFVCLSFLQ